MSSDNWPGLSRPPEPNPLAIVGFYVGLSGRQPRALDAVPEDDRGVSLVIKLRDVDPLFRPHGRKNSAPPPTKSRSPALREWIGAAGSRGAYVREWRLFEPEALERFAGVAAAENFLHGFAMGGGRHVAEDLNRGAVVNVFERFLQDELRVGFVLNGHLAQGRDLDHRLVRPVRGDEID